MKSRFILFWQKYAPYIELLWIILLLIGNTFMKYSMIFKSIAVGGWIVCVIMYILTKKNYRTVRFWLFLILGLILAINQTLQLINMAN